MSVCLDYQKVYSKRRSLVVSVRVQIIAALVLLVCLAFKVWLRIECTSLGYQIAKERQLTMDLDMQRRELELQISVVKRADNLADKAAVQLGLRPLDPRQARRIIN
ncbi:MAG: hypothetical protein J5J00_08590 [Deltaproteobacteria bacterium]|nr:hypothetical protein [Deltaproteobacteria bacterium]